MASKFQPVILIGKNSYYCEACYEGMDSHPVKSRPTPHCLACGKHHGIAQNCDGSPVIKLDIPFMKLFYTNSKPGIEEHGLV